MYQIPEALPKWLYRLERFVWRHIDEKLCLIVCPSAAPPHYLKVWTVEDLALPQSEKPWLHDLNEFLKGGLN